MPKSFLQSREWATFKTTQGWQVVTVAGFRGLVRKLPLGLTFLYLPEIDLGQRQIPNLVKEVRKYAVGQYLSFARLEFFNEFDELDAKALAQADTALKKLGLIKSSEEMQPEFRQVIDLKQSEQELLNQMKPKGRYNIKIAQRDGVVVQKSQHFSSKLKTFYELYRESARRDGFTARSLRYFKQMATHMTGQVSIYVASWRNKPLTAALMISWQDRVCYLYGGSSSEHRNVMAPYLLHWQIIKDAKRGGAAIYDLLAIAPPNQPHHKFAGLRRFKQQFGGRSVRLLGSYDLMFDPARYRLFNSIERVRGRIR